MAKQIEFLSAVDTVAKSLGYNCLKDEQKVILQELLKNRDIFAVLPTGRYGKSMCYISLPLVIDYIDYVTGIAHGGAHSIQISKNL